MIRASPSSLDTGSFVMDKIPLRVESSSWTTLSLKGHVNACTYAIHVNESLLLFSQSLYPFRTVWTCVDHCGPMPTDADQCRTMRTRADQCGVSMCRPLRTHADVQQACEDMALAGRLRPHPRIDGKWASIGAMFPGRREGAIPRF